MCNCIDETSKKIIEKLKSDNPEKTYNESLNGFMGTGFANQCVSFSENGGNKLYNEFRIESTFIKTNGDTSKPKKETISIYPSFCCFCGVKFD